MTKTLEEIDAQIEALQEEREKKLKADKENAKKTAKALIEQYEFTLGDFRGKAQSCLLNSITKLGDDTLKRVKLEIEEQIAKPKKPKKSKKTSD